MPTKEERIKVLKNRAAGRLDKINSLPAVVKLRAAAEAKAAEAAKLEADYFKEQADRRRKDDIRAKILLGVGILGLPDEEKARAIGQLRRKPNDRDRKWIDDWCGSNQINTKSPEAEEKPVLMLMAPSDPFEAVDGILKRIIGGLSEGAIGLFAPDLLTASENADRAVLEAWFASPLPPHE